MPSTIILDFGVDEYRLRNGDDESDPVRYGDAPCILESKGKTYIALVEEADEDERISMFGEGLWVMECKPAKCQFTEYDETEDADAEPELDEDDDLEGEDFDGGEEEDEDGDGDNDENGDSIDSDDQ